MVAGASRSRTADSKRLWILSAIWVFRAFSALRFFGRLAAPSWPPSAFSRGLLCAAFPRFESGRPTCCPLCHHPDPAAGGDAPLKSSRPASPTAAPALCTPPSTRIHNQPALYANVAGGMGALRITGSPNSPTNMQCTRSENFQVRTTAHFYAFGRLRTRAHPRPEAQGVAAPHVP